MIEGVLILAALVGSALFAGLETGLVTANRVRLRVQAGRGDAASRRILAWLDRPERVLSTFLVGNTLCNVGGGALATAWATEHVSETAGPILATAVMTAVFLVVGEVLPKNYFRVRGDVAVPRLLWFISFVSWLFRPVVWGVSALFRAISGAGGRSPFVTREELRQLLREGGARLGAGERRLLENVFDFGRTTAREVMVPLPEVVSLPESATPDEMLAVVREHGFTRVPLYRDRVDRITGVVNVFDLLYDPAPKPTLAAYARPLHVVPDVKRIYPTMVELQRRREAVSLVVNEFGAVVGVVTLADIVEEIMGELADEQEDLGPAIQRVGDAYFLDAATDIDDLNAELGLALVKDQFETVAGMLLKSAGRIPQPGETLRVADWEFEVLAVHPYGIRRVKMRRTPARGPEEAADA